MKAFLRRFMKNKGAVVGLAIFLLVVGVAISAPSCTTARRG